MINLSLITLPYWLKFQDYDGVNYIQTFDNQYLITLYTRFSIHNNSYYQRILISSIELRQNYNPSSVINEHITKGIKEIRKSIYDSCGIKFDDDPNYFGFPEKL